MKRLAVLCLILLLPSLAHAWAPAAVSPCPTVLHIVASGEASMANCAARKAVDWDHLRRDVAALQRKAPKGSETRVIIDADDDVAYADVLVAMNGLVDDSLRYELGLADGPGRPVLWVDMSPLMGGDPMRQAMVKLDVSGPLLGRYELVETGLLPRPPPGSAPKPHPELTTASFGMDGLEPWLAGLPPVDFGLVTPTAKTPWGRVRTVYKVLAARARTGFVSETADE